MKVGRYRKLAVEVTPYDPSAAEVASVLAAAIRRLDRRLAVEHVGSTAVPRCAGKGCVDLAVVVPRGRLAAAKRALEMLGFQRQSTRDPFPESRPMRVGTVRWRGRSYNVHVHVLAERGKEIRQMLAFRDRLRADGRLRTRYVKLKRALVAGGAIDGIEYAQAKSSFFEQFAWRRKTPSRVAR